MVSVGKILGQLSPYQGRKTLVKKNQSVEDIIENLLRTHNQYKKEYDKIYENFVGVDLYDTAENIFDFLKKHTDYTIESEHFQCLKSPSAILHQVKNDCKNYALFIGGVLDALQRNYDWPINWAYRFASYNGSQEPGHVFVVINPGTRQEIWIDPVLDTFNEKKQPTFYEDYKPNEMSLYKISGVDPYSTAVETVFSLFAKSNAPNPNDWQGWTPGDVKQWVMNDGDSIRNEAVNILSYIRAHGLTDITDSDAFGRNRVTVQDIASKLQRAGFTQEAQAFLTGGQGYPNVATQPYGQPVAKNASMNMWLTIGLVLAGGYFIYKASKSHAR